MPCDRSGSRKATVAERILHGKMEFCSFNCNLHKPLHTHVYIETSRPFVYKPTCNENIPFDL